MNYEGTPGLEFGDGQVKVDPSVLAHLPTGCKILAVEKHGVSFWASTGRIDVDLPDNSNQTFFIKAISKEVGRRMVQSEYESMKTVHKTMPEFAPKPIAWGTYETNPDTHFFLCEFRDMIEEMPEPFKFAIRLAALHSRGKSPTGKFGFHIPTYSGNLPQMTEWEDSWETFFAKNFRKALDLEVAAKGWDPAFDELVPVIFDRVIPRLLRPLESEGRRVVPSLVHGDLWFANAGLDLETGEPLVFDACCFYAHNEYEFGQWRPICNKFGAEYLDAYHTFVQISAPEEDYEGRLDLYKLRFNTHVSALFFDNSMLREQMLGDMRDLVARYG